MKTIFKLIKNIVLFIAGIFSSKANESLKRVIAFMFSITLIVAYFISNNLEVDKLLIYCFCGLIALLLGLATIENITNIFKK